MPPLVPIALLGAGIVGAWAYILWVARRTAPAQVLAAFESVRKHLKEQAREITEVQEQMLALRGSWRVQAEELEKYLDSIDSRARRFSATASNAKRRAAENGPQEDQDPETALAQLRTRAGL